MGWLPVSYLYLINILYAMFVLINLLGCVWLFTAEAEGASISWLIEVGGFYNSPLSPDLILEGSSVWQALFQRYLPPLYESP